MKDSTKAIKPTPNTDNGVAAPFSQKNLQATEEQIRYAKLSQMTNKDDTNLQEKIKEVSEITRKPPDLVSLALHDFNNDTNLAVQNIIEGYYDDCLDGGEWKTTKQTKKGKKGNTTLENNTHNHTDCSDTTGGGIDKLCSDFGGTDADVQKTTSHKPNRLSRGGRGGRLQSSENWHDDKSPPEERGFGDPSEKSVGKESSRGRSNDRGRGRGRGRGGMRGGTRGGIRGRGGFNRNGPFRGSSRQSRGGGFNRRGGSRDANTRRQENDMMMMNNATTEESWDLDSPEKPVHDKVADWSDDVANDGGDNDWSKDEPEWGKGDSDWVKENTSWASKDEWGEQSDNVENLFNREREVEWAQLNGQVQDTDTWNNSNNNQNDTINNPAKDDRLKYLPENIDTAVIRSIPNSSTGGGDVTSYQPADDLSRYINTPSNQFPSSHQEGGLTSSLNDPRTFSLPNTNNTTTNNTNNIRTTSDNIHRTISSMPIVSGVTESHKLEQEQLRPTPPKPSPLHVHSKPPPRRTNKYVNLPSQPVVMPRSAKMVNDIEEQFSGLEFGSGPLSPHTTASKNTTTTNNISNNTNNIPNNIPNNTSTNSDTHSPLVEYSVSSCSDVTSNVLTDNGSSSRQHPVALPPVDPSPLMSHAPTSVLPPQPPQQPQPQPQSSIIAPSSTPPSAQPPQPQMPDTTPPLPATNQMLTKPDVLKTPPGFKPLDQNTPHYLGSPGRGHPHPHLPEPIPFPSSTNRTSPKSTINVFSRNGGLGTSVVVTEQQPSISTNFQDQQKVFEQQHENNINAEKIIAEQNKQYRAEQLALSEKNARAAVEQQQQRGVPFSEEKPQVPTNKLLNPQIAPSQIPPSNDLTAEELVRTTDRLTGDLPEQRKTIADTINPLNDAHRQNLSAKDGLKLSKNEVPNVVPNKMHGGPPGAPTNQMSSLPQKSTYTPSEMLNNLSSTTHAHTTVKTQVSGKTTSAPPGVLPMNLYAGVQPGLMPTAYQQQALHGYSYDDLLQMQRVPMPPYTYDVSMFQAAAAAAGPTSAREGLPGYQGTDSKFSRGADESSPVNIPQGTAHVAPGNLPTQQQAAYMNATGQLPAYHGYAYTYQPNVLPQGGVYPAFTTQGTMYQMQGKGTQYQTQFQSAQQQQGHYNSSKFSGTTSHEFSKGNFHHNPSLPLAAHPKGTQQNTSSTSSSTTIQSGPRSAYNKPQYTGDGKGYPSNSPTSLTAQQQHNMQQHMASHPSPHMNHYLQLQPHTNLMTHSGTNLMTHTGQISASHINHQPQMDSHRSQVHQMPFSANQQKRGDSKGTYGSYWR